jgi:hypothetical protein
MEDDMVRHSTFLPIHHFPLLRIVWVLQVVDQLEDVDEKYFNRPDLV